MRTHTTAPDSLQSVGPLLSWICMLYVENKYCRMQPGCSVVVYWSYLTHGGAQERCKRLPTRTNERDAYFVRGVGRISCSALPTQTGVGSCSVAGFGLRLVSRPTRTGVGECSSGVRLCKDSLPTQTGVSACAVWGGMGASRSPLCVQLVCSPWRSCPWRSSSAALVHHQHFRLREALVRHLSSYAPVEHP